jgi:hypothetical protein
MRDPRPTWHLEYFFKLFSRHDTSRAIPKYHYRPQKTVAAPVLTRAKMAQPEGAAASAVETLIGNCFPLHLDESHGVGIWDAAVSI